MTEEDIQKLSKEQLQDIVLKIHKILTSGQKKELRKMIKVYKDQSENGTSQSFPGRMSDDFVKEKMMQIQEWEHKIDEGELYLNIEEYEDYSDRYWDPDWIIKYYDNQGICDKIQYMIQFAADCIDDRRYQEAHEIYEWIWQMSVSLKAAFASSCLDHQEKMMQFCRECFVSDSTVKNFLRLFGMEEMAETYGTQGKEILINTAKGNPQNTCYNLELHRNIMCDFTYYSLVFYTGDFDKAKNICKNSKESLGWSRLFIQDGIRLFLLYLYDRPFPSKSAENIVYKRADAYSDGAAEKFFGEVLKEYPRNELVVSSKVYFPTGDGVNDRGLSRKHRRIIWFDNSAVFFCTRINCGVTDRRYLPAAVCCNRTARKAGSLFNQSINLLVLFVILQLLLR